MEETKIVIFEYNEDWKNTHKEEMEFDINTTDNVIQEAFEDWVWNIIGDKVNWYEK